MAKTMDYITVTDRNLSAKDTVFDATVVANYGDPGLDEDFQFDILSRFLICKLESSNRTLTADRYKNMLILVRRPPTLWIDYQGGFQNNPSIQQRIDANLNVNVGSAANYSSNAIPKMNIPYRLGSKIKVKLIKDSLPPQVSNADTFFISQCNTWDANSLQIAYYNDWHNQGLNSNTYIVSNNGALNLRMKTIVPTDNTNANYTMTINKIQYEAYLLSLFPDKANSLISLFTNSATQMGNYYYNSNGGYAFATPFSLNLNFCKYEDINVDGRSRTSITNCMPLLVTAPSTFTVPKVRTSGTVNYLPTYITKS